MNQRFSATPPGDDLPDITLLPEESVEPETIALKLMNEGCVAVEHLNGSHRLYRRHLRRSVLCGRGVCAATNHALVVDGMYTSMQTLCTEGGLACVRTTKLVNNLRMSQETRLPISNITRVPITHRRFRHAVRRSDTVRPVVTCSTHLTRPSLFRFPTRKHYQVQFCDQVFAKVAKKLPLFI